MTYGLNGVVCGVDDGQQGCQDPEEDASRHQGDRGDVQLVQQEGPLPRN